jgi:hypothetical protein
MTIRATLCILVSLCSSDQFTRAKTAGRSAAAACLSAREVGMLFPASSLLGGVLRCMSSWEGHPLP